MYYNLLNIFINMNHNREPKTRTLQMFRNLVAFQISWEKRDWLFSMWYYNNWFAI